MPCTDGPPWMLTTVYGPHEDQLKHAFLEEMKHIYAMIQAPWLITGDFNLMYKACDKNNQNLNRSLMAQFRLVLDHCE